MSNNSVVLFDSILESFMVSLSPVVDQVFSEFEGQVSSGNCPVEKLDSILEKTLTSFPRSHSSYTHIIKTLTTFARTNPPAIITSLCSKFKSETNRTENGTSSVLIQMSSLTFNPTNTHHFNFLHYLNLIILSDLIFSIYTEYPNRQVSKLVPCGYNLCTTCHRLKNLQILLIDTWSLIFYHLSTNSLEDITRAFDQHIDDTNSGRVFHLISHVQGNQQLADSLLYALHQAKKRKALNSDMLSHLSVLLSRLDCDQSVLNEFFKLAWEAKAQHGIKHGAIDLITTLFNRLPSQAKKQQNFYQTRVFKHAHDDRKIERSLHAFLRLIRGDISQVLDAGDGTDPIAFIESKPESSGESFLNIFMRIFFAKSNFGICPELFRDVLVHLASLDIHEFTSSLLPKFLSLDPNDPRFMVILMTVPLINRKEFATRSYCQAKEEQIKELNQLIRGVLMKRISLIENESKKKTFVLIQDSFQIQAALDEADHEVEEFIGHNDYEIFKPNLECPNTRLRPGDSKSIVLHMMKCIPPCFTTKDFMKEELVELILLLTVNEDQLLCSTAMEVYNTISANKKVEKFIVEIIMKLITNMPVRELRARLLQLLFQSIMKPSFVIPDSMFLDIEVTALYVFMSDLSRCRAIAMRILKHLGALGKSEAFEKINENSDRLSANVNRTVLILNIPPKPSVAKPPLGRLEYDIVCSSKYFDIWIIFYAEILNVIIENKPIMMQLRAITSRIIDKVPSLIESNTISCRSAAAVYLIYFDSLTIEKKFDCLMNFFNDEEEDNERLEEEDERLEEDGDGDGGGLGLGIGGGGDLQSALLAEKKQIAEANAAAAAADISDLEKDIIIPEAEELFKKVVESDSLETKRALFYALRYMNWRIIPSILPPAVDICPTLYPEFSTALSVIIQNEDNFQHIISQIFNIFLKFLSLLQDDFTRLKINNTRSIQFDFDKLEENQEVCLNYCILISAAFNNISEQLPEDQFPVSYRQILFNFLIHWAQLPDRFEKLRSYALNALIPIIHAGTIFTNGFEFDLNIFDMMVQCQLSGFPVLDSLLIFHFDILIDIYVKQAFLKPRRESQLFIDAVLSSLEHCEGAELLHKHVGSLVLLVSLCGTERLEIAQVILTKLAQLFLNRPFESTSGDSDSIRIVSTSTNLDFVPTLFQFATEEYISASFEIIRDSKNATVVKQIVKFLKPWFSRIRLLPKGTYIIQGVPTKFRVYNVLSFVDAMFDVTRNLTDEQLDIFASLWFELLQSADNNVVVLLCLTELDDAALKEKIFSELLDKDPVLISKYLAKLCSFRYWYFMMTQRSPKRDGRMSSTTIGGTTNSTSTNSTNSFGKIDVNSMNSGELNSSEVNSSEISSSEVNTNTGSNVKRPSRESAESEEMSFKWLQNVLTRAFIDYVGAVAPICFTLTLHYAMLFIEEAQELFEALISILEVDEVDEMYFWTPDFANGTMKASEVAETIAEVLRSQNQTEAIEKWTQEAIRWAVGCSDIRLAYRSLVILNGLRWPIEQHFETLLFEAVSYHLSQCHLVVREDIREDVVNFVGESFRTLRFHIDNSEFANLAFHYASAFIGCEPFESNCMEKAMPIFEACVEQEVLKKQAIPVLVDAFFPFARTLETNRISQITLTQIIDKVKANELYLVAATFLVKPLPFIAIDKTYAEITRMEFTIDQVHKAFWFYQAMLKTASRPLADSILILSTNLIVKYGKKLNRSMLVPIYNAALQRIAVFKSAIDFLQAISDIDPSIASLKDEGQQQDIIPTKSLEDVRNDIKETVDGFSNSETVPFTNCKQLSQLHGMISMMKPPKIYPFSTQYEVYLGMKKEQKKFLEKMPKSPQRWSSTLSLTSQLMSNKSLVIASTMQVSGMKNITFHKLKRKKVEKKKLDLPVEDEEGGANWKFVVSLVEFNKLSKLED